MRRRRLLAATSAAGFSAAFLAACGGDDDGGGDEAASDRLAPDSDSSKEAKRGGNITVRVNSDLATMDPHLLIFGALNAALAYGRLFRVKPGVNEPATGEAIGDMVKSWEFSPDNLKLTMKLQDNNNWHNIAPVNGRPVVAEDIVASWGRYVKQGQTATNYSNEKNPGSPVLRMTAVDSKTVVMDLARPNSGITRLFATGGGGAYFVPREAAAGDYDLRSTAIGSGPW
jgi:peptide/nickel transport system substrate-binding protein